MNEFAPTPHARLELRLAIECLAYQQLDSYLSERRIPRYVRPKCVCQIVAVELTL